MNWKGVQVTCRWLFQLTVSPFAGFDFLTAVLLDIRFFWDTTLCHWASVVLDVSKDINDFMFRVQRSKKTWAARPWTDLDLRSFETSGTTRPTTQRHVPEDVNRRTICLTAGIISTVTEVRIVDFRIKNISQHLRNVVHCWDVFSLFWHYVVPSLTAVLLRTSVARCTKGVNRLG
jgi:hypothetical protein